MKYVLSMSLISCCVLAAYFAIQVLIKYGKKYYENRLLFLICLSSAVWSFGFGGLIIQTNVETAYIWRAIGMVGVFLYLISVQMLICYLSNIRKIFQYILNGIAFLGIVIFFFVVQKNQTIYYLYEMGMTYYFKIGIWNRIYTIYTVVVAMDMLVVILYMIFGSSSKRLRAFGKKFFLVESIILAGMMLDTVLPLFGILAVPGSSLTQFLGMVVLYHAITYLNHSRINISNMSEFIYYSLAVPVLVYDTDYKLQILNDAARSFFDMTNVNIEEKKNRIEDLFSIEEKDVFTFEGNRTDIEASCREKETYCSLSVSRIDDAYQDVVGYIIMVTDLTEHIKTVQEMEEAINTAKVASQAKSTFLASMSHEIRTPMNAIMGFSELLLKMELTPEVKDYVEDIKGAAHNLLVIINDILDISKIESGKMELVLESYYVENLLNDVSLIISNQAKKKGLEYNVKIDETIPKKLYGDKVRVRSILINILNNAVKYTKEGSVLFEVKGLEKKDGKVKLEFKVTDTGAGIKEEDKEKLFQSFSQIDRRIHYDVEGSGLGLAIVKGYVTLMDGEIRVDSVYGEGSTFTVVLEQKILDDSPINNAYAKKEEGYIVNAIGNMKIHGIQVLVVDDNPINLKVAGSSMRYYGLEVDMASGGKEAIECCRKKEYQLVFMDQMMPEMDGIEAMKQIRTISPHYAAGGSCKIIVLTADAIRGVRNHRIEEGFDEYLGKPMNYKQLERLFLRFLPPECISQEEGANEHLLDEAGLEDDLLYLKDALPNVNIDKGMNNCGGNLEDYLEILKITWNYGSVQLEELRRLHEDKDYENYTIKIHSMKSTTKNVGAMQLSDLARNQEEAGCNDDFSYIDEHMEEFQTEYRELLTRIEFVLRHYNRIDDSKQQTQKEILTDELIAPILQNICQNVETFAFTKVFDILDEVKKYEIPSEYQEVFDEIAKKMENLETDEVLDIIEKTKKE